MPRRLALGDVQRIGQRADQPRQRDLAGAANTPKYPAAYTRSACAPRLDEERLNGISSSLSPCTIPTKARGSTAGYSSWWSRRPTSGEWRLYALIQPENHQLMGLLHRVLPHARPEDYSDGECTYSADITVGTLGHGA